MSNDLREFLKGGANVHVKQHYRMHNGKLVYVQAHDKAIQTGTEAQLHERVQFGKNKAHLLAVDPEDRDAIAKHASALGIKHDISYQGGKIRDHEGNVEKHGFYYHKFASEEDAKKVHAMLHPQAEESGEPKGEPEQPEGKIGTHPNDAEAESEKPVEAPKEGTKPNSGDALPNNDAALPNSGDSPWGEDTPENIKSWIAKKKAEYGSATKWQTSEEYKKVYPKIKAAYDKDLEQWSAKTAEKTKSDMEGAGVKFGDKIAVFLPNMMGLGGTTFVGTLAKKGPQAIVKFGHSLPTVQGQKSVVWTPSMKKAEEGAATEEKPVDTPKEETKPEPEAPKEAAGDANTGDGPYPSGWDDNPSYSLKNAMIEAAAAFHDDPEKAIQLLRQGAALAKKHGIDYTHGNGMNVNADWMEKKASEMEAALPKEEPAPEVNEKYAEAAKNASEASSAAHEATKGMRAGQLNGDFGPENAHAAMKGHHEAGNAHIKALHAHKTAASNAPTPELKSYHEKKAEEHDQHSMVHSEAAKMHETQHNKNQAQDTYDTEQAKADAESETANDQTSAIGNLQDGDDHSDAVSLHESAAKAHTGMIQHALANGDEQAANEHASIASQHQKKAAYHKAASAAWKATHSDEVDHAKAAELHVNAAQAAKHAGMSESVSTGHENYAKAHGEKAKTPDQKKADEATEEANDWSWTPNMEPDQHVKAAKAHNIAGAAHMKAAEGATDANKHGHYAQAKNHANMVDYHNKAGIASGTSSEAEAFHGVEHKHTSAEHKQAASLHTKAAGEHTALAAHPAISGSQKHQAFHAEAAAHHQEMAEKHTKFAASHKAGEEEDAAGDAEAAKKAEPTNPWASGDHMKIAALGHKAYTDGNYAEAVKHYKHAAVVAHHSGDPDQAQHLAQLAKESMAKMKGVQKAVDTDASAENLQQFVVAIQSAAIHVHQEKQQIRNLLKAVDTMPSFVNLQKACSQATKAGITDLETIVAHALGGKKQAAPYLTFLSALQ